VLTDHFDLYHGKAFRKVEEIYRGRAKSGIIHFHAYATCYVVHKGRRFTIGVIRVEKDTSMVTVLMPLLRMTCRGGVQLRLLLLDRGFYSVEVIR
jgi:hypothetical protein